MITKEEALAVLNENILSFWQEKMVDETRGGFYGRIDGQGQLHVDADKAIILNTRILWTFSAAYRQTNDAAHLAIADRAYDYLTSYFFDTEQGGVYWSLDCEGQVTEDKKQVYAQAFAIYALSEYHQVSPQRDALKLAQGLFQLLEQHSYDASRNGYYEAFDREWGVIDDVRLSEKDMNATKTMNTHLHILEAYTNLYRVWKDDQLGQRLKNLIELMSSTFISASDHFNLFFDDDWTLLSDEISYGHDIEGSWLLAEAAEVLGDDVLTEQTNLLALKMADAAMEGLDSDGGLMNEASPHGLTDTDKHWWPQAEALVGLVNAWQVSGKDSYLEQANQIWTFTKANIIDPSGEWFWRVKRQGERVESEDKAGPWKCPYHNGRAMLELINRLEK
ncbi:AGE family epimerase/isomerase [Gilvimarinus agarilyticus]|uniref:AGE family epimerase/isomerase n=1 Tax=Reichenbachiella agariperforans TaxID=156994 RepID=UPI001C09FD78|nr:AGE family epimerase/isomerase [Reichenbachiella agariperforans]MBU2884730.1 AGE family epimerase/isomerase [Gilvimarinus agarilyticus]MBU2914948.1 AGE family epimerase/isomerase [Reichenbachiella agariperforans]